MTWERRFRPELLFRLYTFSPVAFEESMPLVQRMRDSNRTHGCFYFVCIRFRSSRSRRACAFCSENRTGRMAAFISCASVSRVAFEESMRLLQRMTDTLSTRGFLPSYPYPDVS